ncbi:MAG TPA: FAD-dependent oxidoreductase, partial [Acidimicrobiales bacterium]|nr:FAD-dependent oxidoreductase [Acidimicrobiales bacterium]
GYTGLWTAWAVAGARPDWRVVVVEGRHAGYGASGRNGGWLSGLLPGNPERLARRHPSGPAGVVALQRALRAAVDEVAEVCAGEGIDCDLVKDGTVKAAVNQAQLGAVRAELVEGRRWGTGADDAWEIGPDEVGRRVGVEAVGGVFSPHCARIQPAKLVRGLARSAEGRGVTIYERSPVLSMTPGRAETAAGAVAARWVVRATEGYTASLPGHRRDLLPMNSAMVVTAPLPGEVWAKLGWPGAETFADCAHAYVYAQRTPDGRIALGGRGVPYRFGSRTDDAGRSDGRTSAALAGRIAQLWPAAAGVGIDYAWCGVLGVARDWCPAVHADPETGLAWAGGYVGDGVTTSYLAGRTLADLVCGEVTERVGLPWVGHRSRRWEPEPLRYLGVRTVYGLYRAADRAESRRAAGGGRGGSGGNGTGAGGQGGGAGGRGRPSLWAKAAALVAGR